MKFKPILKTKYTDFGALYECPVCHKQIDIRHIETPNFCPKCGIAFEWEWESDEEKRRDFAKQILDYWDKQGTVQTIRFLKDIAEVD